MARASQCGAIKGFAFVRSTSGPTPQSANSYETRQHVLDRLRLRIQQIENSTPQFSVEARAHSHGVFAAGSPSGLLVEDGGILPRDARTPMPSSSSPSLPSRPLRPPLPAHAWSLGDPALDDLVGPKGLETNAVHELKAQFPFNHSHSHNGEQHAPHWAGRWSAARRFLLALIIRRFAALGVQATGSQSGPGILWCWPRVMAQEFGELYAPGLTRSHCNQLAVDTLGLSANALTIVEPSRSQDVLWAMEEGLKSQALACVVGVLDDVDLTPARRLALAAQKNNIPALVLTSPRAPPMAATATRWRIAPAPSAQHPIEANLPGRPRLRLCLERRRSHPVTGSASEAVVDWHEDKGAFHPADDAQKMTPDVHWQPNKMQRFAL